MLMFPGAGQHWADKGPPGGSFIAQAQGLIATVLPGFPGAGITMVGESWCENHGENHGAGQH